MKMKRLDSAGGSITAGLLIDVEATTNGIECFFSNKAGSLFSSVQVEALLEVVFLRDAWQVIFREDKAVQSTLIRGQQVESVIKVLSYKAGYLAAKQKYEADAVIVIGS